LFLMTVAIVGAFGIAAFVGSIAMMTTPAVAQNMTGDNAMMAGNMTSSNTTGGNWTK
jgi:hypothetical protein